MRIRCAGGIVLAGGLLFLGLDPPLTAQPRFDTLAVAGGAFEDNPLFLYRQAVHVHLLDPTTVVFADNAGGRIVAVDLVTGDGWEVEDRGGTGPGEFGGALPWVAVADGRIHTLTITGHHAVRDPKGAILEEGRFEGPELGGLNEPQGFLRPDVLVTRSREDVDFSREGIQETRRWIAAHHRDGRELWRFDDLPPQRMSIHHNDDGTGSGSSLDPGLIVRARDETVVLGLAPGRELRVLGADGEERGRIELPEKLWDLRIDAEERIWATVWSYERSDPSREVVYDRDLRQLFNEPSMNVVDAQGTRRVVVDLDEVHGMRLVLLERRER